MIPTNEEFLVIAPENDVLEFYMGYVVGYSYNLDCVYTVNMPSADGDNCNLPSTSDVPLACKTVSIDECTIRDTHVFEDWNDDQGDEACPGQRCAFMYSQKSTHFNYFLRPTMIFYHRGYYWEDTPYRFGTTGEEGEIKWIDSTFPELKCQDLDNDAECDIERMSQTHSNSAFGGVGFDRFRGLLRGKDVYDVDNNLVASVDYTYGINGSFQLDGPGIMGYLVEDYHSLSAIPNDYSGNKNLFPYSAWITLDRVDEMTDGQTKITTYEYADNGLPRRMTTENVIDGNTIERISETHYVGDVEDCVYGGIYLRSDDNKDYHVWNAIKESFSRDGSLIGGYDVVSSIKNEYNENRNCYFYENYVWDDINDNHVINDNPPNEEEYGEFLSQVALRDSTYDRAVMIKDSLNDDIDSISYYSTSAENCAQDFDGKKLTCIEDALGNQVRYYYDEYGRINEVKDPNEQSTFYYYDDLHRLERVSVITGDGSEGEIIYDYNYGMDEDNNCDILGEEDREECMNWVKTTTKMDEEKNSISISYADGLGRHMQSSAIKNDENAIIVDTTYNEIAKVDTITEPREGTIGFFRGIINDIFKGGNNEQDLLGWHPREGNGDTDSVKNIYYNDPLARVKQVFPLSIYNEGDEELDCGEGAICTQMEYSGDGDYRYQTVTDAEGKQAISKSDKFGNVIEIEDSLGQKTNYEYDILGQLEKVYDAKNRLATENSYNTLGQLEGSDNIDSGLASYTYDLNGNIETITNANGDLIENFYDELNRIDYVELNGLKILENSYDYCENGIGRLCKIDNNLYNNEIEYEYDEKGQITKVIETINNNEYVTEYDYDLAGNVVSILTQDGGLTEYEYNMLGQLWKIKIDGEEVEYEYNPEGTVDWIDFPGESSFVDYNYNERNWVDYIDISSPSEGQMFREDYLYDDVGNLRNIQDMEGKTAIFGYDDLYRLKLFDGSYYGGREVQYGYDEVGNRELRVQIGGPQDLTWPEDYVYDSESNKLIETIIEGCIYDYDDVGNMIEKDCEGDITEYDYDINNLIEKIELPDGTKMIFQYDALGRRVSKKVSVGRVKTQTIYSYGLGSSPLMEFTSSTLGDGEPDIQVARPL